MKITYVKGDATLPIGDGFKVICHCCNDIGAWGAGFVMALSRRWPITKQSYHQWQRTGFCEGVPFSLGEVQLVEVGEEITVANIIGQEGIRRRGKEQPIRYGSIRKAFGHLCNVYQGNKAVSFHMPRIGCGLAGGSWSIMEEIIESTLVNNGFKVYVYDLK